MHDLIRPSRPARCVGTTFFFFLSCFPLLLTVKAGSERAHKLLTHAYTMPIPKSFPISLWRSLSFFFLHVLPALQNTWLCVGSYRGVRWSPVCLYKNFSGLSRGWTHFLGVPRRYIYICRPRLRFDLIWPLCGSLPFYLNPFFSVFFFFLCPHSHEIS